jgi:hypothetical protein
MRTCECGCGASLDGQKSSVRYASRMCMEGMTPRVHVRGDWTASERETTTYLRLDPCSYCGEPAGTIDHIDPLRTGGERVWENLTAACQRCNSSKGTRPLLFSLLGISVVDIWRAGSLPAEHEGDAIGYPPPRTVPVPALLEKPAPRQVAPLGERMIDLEDAVEAAFDVSESLKLPLATTRELVRSLIELVDDDSVSEPERDLPKPISRLVELHFARRVSPELWEQVSERIVDEMLVEEPAHV